MVIWEWESPRLHVQSFRRCVAQILLCQVRRSQLCRTMTGFHFDLYRLEDASELTEVGLEHAIANDITLIEWPEIAQGVLPVDTISVRISQCGDGRKIVID